MFSNLRGSPLVLCQFLLEIHAFIPKQAGVSGEEPPEKQKKGGLMAISQKRVEKQNQVLQWHPAFFAGVYGYAYFYKADRVPVNEVLLEERTISLVSERYPKKLLGYLKKQRGFRVIEKYPGIYYVEGDVLPVQIVNR